jgi:hypothetical protein
MLFVPRFARAVRELVDNLNPYTPMNEVYLLPLPLRAEPKLEHYQPAAQNPGGEFWTVNISRGMHDMKPQTKACAHNPRVSAGYWNIATKNVFSPRTHTIQNSTTGNNTTTYAN